MRKLFTWLTFKRNKDPVPEIAIEVPQASDSETIFHQCMNAYLRLQYTPASQLEPTKLLPFPTGRFHLLKPVLYEWASCTRKDERVQSESISLTLKTETLDSFFYTQSECYGDIATLLPEFIELVIDFCQAIIETQDNQFGATAFNRRHAFWLADKLLEVAVGLLE